MYEFMLLGLIRFRKSTYSSEWNCDISRFVAGFALYEFVILQCHAEHFRIAGPLTNISIFLYNP